MNIEKGKTSNGYAKTKVLLKNNAIALDGWRYFFMVMINTIKEIIYIEHKGTVLLCSVIFLKKCLIA